MAGKGSLVGGGFGLDSGAAMGNQGPAIKAEQQPPCPHGQQSCASHGESGWILGSSGEQDKSATG